MYVFTAVFTKKYFKLSESTCGTENVQLFIFFKDSKSNIAFYYNNYVLTKNLIVYCINKGVRIVLDTGNKKRFKIYNSTILTKFVFTLLNISKQICTSRYTIKFL